MDCEIVFALNTLTAQLLAARYNHCLLQVYHLLKFCLLFPARVAFHMGDLSPLSAAIPFNKQMAMLKYREHNSRVKQVGQSFVFY